ncbi:hypothetical protein AKJ16_DCAP08594 [Drosera capensis]
MLDITWRDLAVNEFVTKQYLLLPTAMLDITWRDLVANEEYLFRDKRDSEFSKRENRASFNDSCHFIAVTLLCNVMHAGLAGIVPFIFLFDCASDLSLESSISLVFAGIAATNLEVTGPFMESGTGMFVLQPPLKGADAAASPARKRRSFGVSDHRQ